MSIVATEVESVHGAANQQRFIFYRCQDDHGQWHSHGPVITTDPNFNVEAHKTVVAAAVVESLAQTEFEEVIR